MTMEAIKTAVTTQAARLLLAQTDASAQLNDLIALGVHQDWRSLEFVVNQTPVIARAGVTANGGALRFVQPHLQTLEVVEAAMRCRTVSSGGDQHCGGELLRFVKHPQQTLAIVELAVGLHGGALEFVRPDLVTPELCATALGAPGAVHAVPHIPESLWSPALVARAASVCVRSADGGKSGLSRIPKCVWATDAHQRLLARDFGAGALRALAFHGLPVCDDTARLAVARDCLALGGLPEPQRSASLCEWAVGLCCNAEPSARPENWEKVLTVVPPAVQTLPMLLALVRVSPHFLKHMGPHLFAERHRGELLDASLWSIAPLRATPSEALRAFRAAIRARGAPLPTLTDVESSFRWTRRKGEYRSFRAEAQAVLQALQVDARPLPPGWTVDIDYNAGTQECALVFRGPGGHVTHSEAVARCGGYECSCVVQ